MPPSKSRINPGNDDDPATAGEKASWALVGVVMFILGFLFWVASVTP